MTRTVVSGIAEGRDVCFAGEQLFVATGVGLERVDDGVATVVMAFKWGTDLVRASPDGSLVFCNEAKRVHTVDVRTGSSTMTWASAGEGPSCVAPSPDGRGVIVVGGDEGGTLKRHTIGVKRATQNLGGFRYGQVAWLDDRQFVSATAPHHRTVLTLHSADGARLMALGDTDSGGPVCVRDGNVCIGTRAGVFSVALKPSTGLAHTTPLWTGGAVHALTASGSDVFIASDVGVFVVDAAGAARQLDDTPAIAVAAHHTQVAVVGADGSVVVLRL
jgi:hypothetical protein